MQNVQACDIQCVICKSTFLKTSKAPQYVPPTKIKGQMGWDGTNRDCRLTEHAENKHGKNLQECFPTFVM